jgi:hypothetical protein
MIPMFRSGYELGRRNEFRYSRMALGAVFESFDISDRRTITDNEWGYGGLAGLEQKRS